jgi:hypothetical protein
MLRAALSLAHYTNKSELAVEFDFLEQFQEHERCGMTGQERESSTTSSPHSTEFDDCHLIGAVSTLKKTCCGFALRSQCELWVLMEVGRVIDSPDLCVKEEILTAAV